MTTKLKWISALTVATVIFSTSLSADAAKRADDIAPTRTVRAWDLDLTKSDDVKTLYRRVQGAVRDVAHPLLAALHQQTSVAQND
jgi:UrcA family protein